MLKPWMFPVVDEDICRQIVHHEHRLDELLDSLDDHDLCAREIDSSEVGAWKTKYHAWVIRGRVVIQIDKVSVVLDPGQTRPSMGQVGVGRKVND
jgi:hypothetical protein